MKHKTFRIGLLFMLLSLKSFETYADGIFRIMEGITDNAVKTEMEKNVNQMISVFNTSVQNGGRLNGLSKQNFTPEAIKELSAIWKSSGMVIPEININARCLRIPSGFQVRGIPVDVIEADSAERRQELAIDFTPKGIISNVAIAMEMHLYDEIMATQESDIDYARRQIIINFMDNYRTAYNRKDINLLNSVFSDKALIITGKVLKEKPNSDITWLPLNNNNAVYIKQTKQEYLKKLKNVFKATKFVNVKFEDIEVVRHPKYDDIYGVTLKQYWHTNNYQDEGYLFLMIDFHDADFPLIQVRTWQPYKNNLGEVVTSEEDIFHLGSFKIKTDN